MRGISDRDPINLQPGVNHTGGLLVWARFLRTTKKKKKKKTHLYLWTTDQRAVSQQCGLAAVKIRARWHSHDGCPCEHNELRGGGGGGKYRFAYLMSSLSLYSSVFSKRLETSGCTWTWVGVGMLLSATCTGSMSKTHLRSENVRVSPNCQEAAICRCHNPL